MLILILIDIQYSQKAVSSFEKGSKRQNDLSSGFLHAVKKIASPSKNIRFSPLHWGEFTFLSTTYHDLTTIWKILHQWNKFFGNSKNPYS